MDRVCGDIPNWFVDLASKRPGRDEQDPTWSNFHWRKMVKEILREIKKSHGVVVMKHLALKFDLDPNALEGILRTINRSNTMVKTAVPLKCSKGACAGCPMMSSHSNEVCGYKTVMKLNLHK
jgi:hypothetical protein